MNKTLYGPKEAPLKRALSSIVILSLLMAGHGWAADGDPPAPPDSTHAGSTERASADSDGRTADEGEALPSAELTGDLLYQILSAEFEFREGKWEGPFLSYMAAAQSTRDPRLARRAAEIAWSVRQIDPTLAAVRLWRNLAPHSEDAALHYLNLLVMSDSLDEARIVFEKALSEARPSLRGLTMFQIQQRLAQAPDKHAAFQLLQELVAPYDNLMETHLVLAYGASGDGQSPRALDEAHKALKIRPDSELAARTVAQMMPDRSAALHFLESYVKDHPHARNVARDYAALLVEQREYARARTEYERLLRQDPHDANTLYTLGQLARQVKDDKTAERYLKAYLEIATDSINADPREVMRARLQMAQIAEDRKDLDNAIAWLGQIDGGEAYLSAQVWRAQLMQRKGEADAADALLRSLAANDDKEEVQIVIARAQLMRDTHRIDEAMRVLEQASTQFPDNVDLLYEFAMLAERIDKLDLAETQLRKVMALAPDNQQAYNALGYALADRNIRLDEASQLIGTALKLAPDDPFIMDSMGWVQYRLGKLKEAEELLRKAYALRSDPEIAVHLGEVLWVEGHRADASRLWREAVHKDPDNGTLKSTLARLNVHL